MKHEDPQKVVCDVTITVSPASSRDELIGKSYKEPRPESPARPKCISCFERTWIWFFAALLLMSMGLSILSLTQYEDQWLVTSNGGRIGWRTACVDSPKTEDGAEIIVNCQPDDPAQPIGDAVNSAAGQVSDSLLAVSLLAWIVPAVMFAISTYCMSKETCCHGFLLSIFWGVTGSTLFFLAYWYRCLVNDHLTAQSHTVLNVSCMSRFDNEIDICTDVTSLTSCLAKCKAMGDGIVCVGYKDCSLSLRETDCDRDGIGCEATMGWAMLSSLGSSIGMILMSIVLAFGSWNVSKHL